MKKWIKNDKILLSLAITLYFSGYILQFLAADLPVATSIKLFIYCNALFFAFPFVFLGYYIKKCGNKILSIRSNILYATIIAGLILMAVESYFSFTRNYIQDFFAVLLVVCPAIILLILKKSKYSVSDGYTGLLSSGIYFIHPISISLCAIITSNIYPKSIYFGFVFFISLLLSAGVITVNKRIKIFL